MSRLTKIEEECQTVLTVLNDMMAPGNPMTHVDHTALHGKVRDVLRKLQNKEFGCALGVHTTSCLCKG